MTIDIDHLKKILDQANTPTDPAIVAAASAIKVEEIDTSSWLEFGDFFNKPLSRSLVYEWEENGEKFMAQAAFLSVVSTDREYAIKQLRRDLRKILAQPFVKVTAFLAKPSTLAIVSYPDPGEQPDTTMYVDLDGPKPAKRRYAAFCFLHGRRFLPPNGMEAITKRTLEDIGCGLAVTEGEVGTRVEPLDEPSPYLEAADESDFEAETQEMLYPEQRMPPKDMTTYLRPDGKSEVAVTGVRDPVETIAYQYPEFAAAAKKHGVDLTRAPGRELEEMRKFFGQGSGTYLVTVDFQTARTEAFKLDDRAQRKITKALKPAKRKTRAAKKAKSSRKATRRTRR